MYFRANAAKPWRSRSCSVSMLEELSTTQSRSILVLICRFDANVWSCWASLKDAGIWPVQERDQQRRGDQMRARCWGLISTFRAHWRSARLRPQLRAVGASPSHWAKTASGSFDFGRGRGGAYRRRVRAAAFELFADLGIEGLGDLRGLLAVRGFPGVCDRSGPVGRRRRRRLPRGTRLSSPLPSPGKGRPRRSSTGRCSRWR